MHSATERSAGASFGGRDWGFWRRVRAAVYENPGFPNPGFRNLRAQNLKNFKILKFSSETEIFKRATHQTPIFVGGGQFRRSGLKLSSEIEFFQAGLKFSIEIEFFQSLGP